MNNDQLNYIRCNKLVQENIENYEAFEKMQLIMNKIKIVIFVALLISFNSCHVEEQKIVENGTNLKNNSQPDLVYSVPEMEQVLIKKDIPYSDPADSNLTFDIYYPPDFEFDKKIPLVLIIFGFDRQAMMKIGGSFKEMQWYISWGKLIAASGMAAVVYNTTDPIKDLNRISNYIQNNSDELRIDGSNIGIYACSGNVPVAISNVMNVSNKLFKCAVFYYGYVSSSDFKYLSSIDTMANEFGFSNPRLAPVQEWRLDLPILFVRAGLEQFQHLNDSIDHFYNIAISHNFPITIINYSQGRHGFDTYDDTDQSREIIKKTIAFWKFHLLQGN